MGLREMGRWTSDQTIKFAELYHGHECLWNPSHLQYKNRKLRFMAIKDIKVQMGIPCLTEDDVKRKIKSLRSTYCQEVHKINRSVVNDKEVYESTLKWFEIFDSIMHTANGVENPMEDTLYVEEIHPDEICDNSIPDQSAEDPMSLLEVTSITSTHDQQSENQPSLQQEITSGSNIQHKYNTRKGKMKISKVFKASQRTAAISSSKIFKHCERNMNEHEAFGRFVGKTLNGLSPVSAVLAQQEIHQILIQFRLKEAENMGDANIADTHHQNTKINDTS